MQTKLVWVLSSVEALKMALVNMPKNLENLIHHSDRGIQYCAQEYVNVLQDYQVKISRTQNGDPLENVIGRRTAAERINGIVKNELMPNVKIENLEHAQKLLKEIVLIYNDERPHMSIALLTPNQAHQLDGKLKRYWKNYRAAYRYKKATVNLYQDFQL
jgi:transposase InsO family protein